VLAFDLLWDSHCPLQKHYFFWVNRSSLVLNWNCHVRRLKKNFTLHTNLRRIQTWNKGSRAVPSVESQNFHFVLQQIQGYMDRTNIKCKIWHLQYCNIT
jgi:hypothetical protein